MQKSNYVTQKHLVRRRRRKKKKENIKRKLIKIGIGILGHNQLELKKN